MTSTEKQLPIDRIFSRLAATYGAAWDRQSGAAPLADYKTVWVHELSGFLQSREAMMAIAWALEHLPERCPNIIEFRNLCRMAPAPEVPRLPEPKADAERVRAELEKLAPLRALLAQPQAIGDREWASDLLARHQGGQFRSTPAALQMARNALGLRA